MIRVLLARTLDDLRAKVRDLEIHVAKQAGDLNTKRIELALVTQARDKAEEIGRAHV